MKLYEILNPEPPHIKIKEWLDKQGIKEYAIKSDGVVDVDGDVWVHAFSGTALPVQFGKVTGAFFCMSQNLQSLKGVPRVVGGEFNCSSSQITSLTDCPQIVGTLKGPSHRADIFHCHNTRIKSLSGVDKMIKHIGGRFICNRAVTHLLGLLLIKGITDINSSSGPIDQIMNKYKGTGDILSAQDELIDAGFIDQARL